MQGSNQWWFTFTDCPFRTCTTCSWIKLCLPGPGVGFMVRTVPQVPMVWGNVFISVVGGGPSSMMVPMVGSGVFWSISVSTATIGKKQISVFIILYFKCDKICQKSTNCTSPYSYLSLYILTSYKISSQTKWWWNTEGTFLTSVWNYLLCLQLGMFITYQRWQSIDGKFEKE